MQRSLKKAFFVFHKLCSSLGEAISPRAPFAPCLAPTYPGGRTWFLCFFLIHSIHLLSLSCFLQLKRQIFQGSGVENFILFAVWKRNQFLFSSLLSLAQFFCSFCSSAFSGFPHLPIYMNSKPAAPDVTVGWSPCFKK